MSETFPAFEMSPVPTPSPDAVAPEPFRGLYGMPMFVTVPTHDLDASTDFWVRGLGFFELFTIPGRLVHLRRWAFQDVLLTPATTDAAATTASGIQVSFACVLGELDRRAAACRSAAADSVTGPVDTPWNTRDVEVVTPDGVRVVLTAAKPYDPDSAEAQNLAAVGIGETARATGDDNGGHG